MRLIDADKLYQKYDNIALKCNKFSIKLAFIGFLHSALNEAPTVDTTNHGKWINGASFGGVRCSECGYGTVVMLHYSSKFCPNCGARMDVE